MFNTHLSVQRDDTRETTMAKENVTEGEEQKTYEELFCSAGLTDGMHHQLIFLSVFNVLLCIAASVGNAVILVALHKESSLHPPSKLLLRCLAVSDLCVGLVSEPLAAIYWMSAVNHLWNVCYYSLFSSFIVSYTLCSVSLLTLTAISVDRLLALCLGLRYRQIVTLKRTYVIVITFWVLSSVCSTTYLKSYQFTIRYSHVVIVICLVTSIFCYTNIFINLRKRHIQAQNPVSRRGEPSQTQRFNMARYKKALSSALWLQVFLVLCYLPHGVVTALSSHVGLTPSLALIRQFTVTLVYLNSSLNPILYCWKISEVRQAVKDAIKQFFCFSTNENWTSSNPVRKGTLLASLYLWK